MQQPPPVFEGFINGLQQRMGKTALTFDGRCFCGVSVTKGWVVDKSVLWGEEGLAG